MSDLQMYGFVKGDQLLCDEVVLCGRVMVRFVCFNICAQNTLMYRNVHARKLLQ